MELDSRLIVIIGGTVALIALGVASGAFGNNFFALDNTETNKKNALPIATAASLPFEVDTHFEPQLKVGDAELGTGYLKVDTHWMDPEQHCEECTLIEYYPGPQGAAGLAYKNDNTLDFSQAKKVTFFAMGQDGGEKIKFKVAGNKLDKIGEKAGQIAEKGLSKADKLSVFKDHKFSVTTKEVTLRNNWDRYEVSLENANLQDVLYPFALELAKQNSQKVTFYIKGIVFDTERSSQPLAVENELSTNLDNEIFTTSSAQPAADNPLIEIVSIENNMAVPEIDLPPSEAGAVKAKDKSLSNNNNDAIVQIDNLIAITDNSTQASISQTASADNSNEIIVTDIIDEIKLPGINSTQLEDITLIESIFTP